MFRVVIHPGAASELEAIPSFHRRAIVAAIQAVLAHEPTVETRSRTKKMRDDFWPPYRLRVGDFRVYYDVDEERCDVMVLHVWRKGRQQTPGGGVEKRRKR